MPEAQGLYSCVRKHARTMFVSVRERRERERKKMLGNELGNSCFVARFSPARGGLYWPWPCWKHSLLHTHKTYFGRVLSLPRFCCVPFWPTLFCVSPSFWCSHWLSLILFVSTHSVPRPTLLQLTGLSLAFFFFPFMPHKPYWAWAVFYHSSFPHYALSVCVCVCTCDKSSLRQRAHVVCEERPS